MNLNLASILKAGLLMAFIMPAFAMIAMTLPYNNPVFGQSAQVANITNQLNGTSALITQNFYNTLHGLNTTLLSVNGSYYANPTIFQSFAFIVSGFGTIIQDLVEIPYIDQLSLNMLTSGLQLVLPPFAVGLVKVGVGLLYAYMLISMFMLGFSAIEKFDIMSAS